jgi:hypothetical protein
VQLFLPTGLDSPNKKRFSLLINAASLPGFYVQPVVVPYFGAQIKFSGERVFQDWQVQVMNDEDFAVRAVLEKWSNLMNALISNRMDPAFYATGYKASAEVIQYGKDGRKLRSYRFLGLWPNTVEQIQLDWSAIGQVEYFPVSFSLDYFEPTDQSSATDTYNPILSGEAQVSGTTDTPLG